MIVVLVMTDGRGPLIERTLAGAAEHLHGRVTRAVIHDDSGDPDYTAWCRATFPTFTVTATAGRSGFAGAIRSAWAWLAVHTSEPYVFHLEDDFVFRRPVDLDELVGVLDAHPWLVQLALRRQPWNDRERAAGGIVELHPADYTDRTDGQHCWLEHRRFFTTNPSLYRRTLTTRGWPSGPQSEGRFGVELLDAHPDWRFGFWGARDSGEWVEHIGVERAGTGY